MSNDQITTPAPSGQRDSPDLSELQQDRPESAVTFAPQSADEYQPPELTESSLGEALREGAHETGLSIAEVEILAEQLTQTAAESLTEQNCDRELARMYGSPMAVEGALEMIAEAFGDQLGRYSDLLDRTGLGNSAILIQMLHQSAMRKLGRF
jgi:hypothetical protein